MCIKSREASTPFRAEHSMGVTYVCDANGRSVAAMAAPREDIRGPFTTAEQKRWIADNAALLLTAPRLVQYIRRQVIASARDGVAQAQLMGELRLLADARNTSVEFEWEQIRLAVEAEERDEHRLAA